MPTERNAQQVINELWSALALTAPVFEFLEPNQLPPEFQTLLVHEGGMTGTLARHWRESICVEVLSDDMSLEHRGLFRFVILRTESTMNRRDRADPHPAGNFPAPASPPFHRGQATIWNAFGRSRYPL
jgi:hypothetical protein